MYTSKNKHIAVAVIGLGKMGILHSSIINMLPNVELVAIWKHINDQIGRAHV